MATQQYKRDFEALEVRRRRGMQMLTRGVTQAGIARELGVCRQTVTAWAKRLKDDPHGWRRRPLGKPTILTSADEGKLSKLLVKGAVVHGFATEGWTLARVRTLIAREFGHAFSISQVMRLLRKLGFSYQEPEKWVIQRDEECGRNV